MNLQHFHEQNKSMMRQFVAYWNRKHEEWPYEYPLDMLEGDWEEQFDFFVSNQRVEQ